MYIDESTEKENMILGMNPSAIKDERVLEKYWTLMRRRELEENDEDGGI